MTKLVMLGSGTPDPSRERSGPCVAVVVDDNAYLVDFGSNLCRQANTMAQRGIKALMPKNLKVGFLTHLHSDHTLGYPDFLLTPWVVGRKEAMTVIGPVGTQAMTNNLLSAYKHDIDERLHGLMKADPNGITVNVKEITDSGIVYQDEFVTVHAISIYHGTLGGAFSYKFVTPDKTIIISGDKSPCDAFATYAKDCDIMVHEVYPTKNLASRPEIWKNYHGSVHTSSEAVGQIAAATNVKKVVLYHPVYLLGNQTATMKDLNATLKELDAYMIEDVKQNYTGEVYMSQDFDVYE
ncbi:MBL fold metallo-hydrolase [Candidatus Epulonipiscium viviparus]|uniref:MBL fold metallo-hydrolase n=1 Tax=Candidatus Epulonipiscium viviparus TaxID=420336 RepID=UPI002738046D|nr:MBL fold metallo-hydrolase [Candidatus Epulopiscium viviparus]